MRQERLDECGTFQVADQVLLLFRTIVAVPNGDNSSCADECGVPGGSGNSACSGECGCAGNV